jgi:hypothetical protein
MILDWLMLWAVDSGVAACRCGVYDARTSKPSLSLLLRFSLSQ